MLKITLNGLEQRVNIGCRTFVTLDDLLILLKINTLNLSLNGQTIDSDDFAGISIHTGDAINLAR